MKNFAPANILLPKNVAFEKWAVIACDQFTSQPEYWQRVRENVGEEVSTLNLVFPEAELNVDRVERIKSINENPNLSIHITPFTYDLHMFFYFT